MKIVWKLHMSHSIWKDFFLTGFCQKLILLLHNIYNCLKQFRHSTRFFRGCQPCLKQNYSTSSLQGSNIKQKHKYTKNTLTTTLSSLFYDLQLVCENLSLNKKLELVKFHNHFHANFKDVDNIWDLAYGLARRALA